MSWMSSWRISTRIAFGFGLMVLLLGAVMGLTLRNLSAVEHDTQELVGEQAERLALATEWRQNIAVNGNRALAIGLAQESNLGAHLSNAMKALTERTSVIQKRFTALETSTEGKAVLAELGAMRDRYLGVRNRMMEQGLETAEAVLRAEDFKTTLDQYMTMADKLVAYERRRSEASAELVAAQLSAARWQFIGTLVVAALVAVGMGLTLVRSISQPLDALQRTAERIADGDLSQALPPGAAHELGRLQTAMGRMQQGLRDLVREVRGASDAIRTASQEVAAGNTDLSHRTESAASQLQQTASSMEELAGTVRQSAETAGEAGRSADEARDAADRGGQTVASVVQTMSRISDASRRIAEITGVIDGIAFQTNILALNAAVEAARAGEQGRGFAVVAAEVRSLAQRSAAAAREIKGLIADSVERVDEGSRLVGDAGRTMGEIVQTVQRVDALIGEISVAAREQSQGLDQVNGAVADIDRSTQQNAALVEQSAAASDSLQQQATRLSEVVGRFRV
ncbi:MAG: hypothetical protein RLY78_4179 [Pseudomonadota bacterium]